MNKKGLQLSGEAWILIFVILVGAVFIIVIFLTQPERDANRNRINEMANDSISSSNYKITYYDTEHQYGSYFITLYCKELKETSCGLSLENCIDLIDYQYDQTSANYTCVTNVKVEELQ